MSERNRWGGLLELQRGRGESPNAVRLRVHTPQGLKKCESVQRTQQGRKRGGQTRCSRPCLIPIIPTTSLWISYHSRLRLNQALQSSLRHKLLTKSDSITSTGALGMNVPDQLRSYQHDTTIREVFLRTHWNSITIIIRYMPLTWRCSIKFPEFIWNIPAAHPPPWHYEVCRREVRWASNVTNCLHNLFNFISIRTWIQAIFEETKVDQTVK